MVDWHKNASECLVERKNWMDKRRTGPQSRPFWGRTTTVVGGNSHVIRQARTPI